MTVPVSNPPLVWWLVQQVQSLHCAWGTAFRGPPVVAMVQAKMNCTVLTLSSHSGRLRTEATSDVTPLE